MYIVYDLFKVRGDPLTVQQNIRRIHSVCLSKKGAARVRKRTSEPLITISYLLPYKKKKTIFYFNILYEDALSTILELKRLRIAFDKVTEVRTYLDGTINQRESGGFDVIKVKLYK